MTIRTLWPQLLCVALIAASPQAGHTAQPSTTAQPGATAPPGGAAPGAAATEASPSDQAGSPAGTKGAVPAPLMQQAPLQAPLKQGPVQGPVQGPLQAPQKGAVQAPQVVTCTVMVPQVTYKTMTVTQMVPTPEVRQQEVQVCRLVPETKMVNTVQTVVVPEQRTMEQPYTVCRLTMETATRQVTVMVPQMETRQGVRTVCRPVAVQETQTVCRDLGGYQTQTYVDCCGCTQTCQVYVPNIVREQLPVTVYKPQFVEEPFTYQAVTCRPEQRTITQQIAKPVYETKTRQINYTVCVPRQIEKQVPQTTVRPVTETKTVNYTVMVPREVQKQVTVPVCTMVPKQVSYTLPPPCPPCGGCGW